MKSNIMSKDKAGMKLDRLVGMITTFQRKRIMKGGREKYCRC